MTNGPDLACIRDIPFTTSTTESLETRRVEFGPIWIVLPLGKLKIALFAPVVITSPGKTAAPLGTLTPDTLVAPNVVREPAGMVAAIKAGTSIDSSKPLVALLILRLLNTVDFLVLAQLESIQRLGSCQALFLLSFLSFFDSEIIHPNPAA